MLVLSYSKGFHEAKMGCDRELSACRLMPSQLWNLVACLYEALER